MQRAKARQLFNAAPPPDPHFALARRARSLYSLALTRRFLAVRLPRTGKFIGRILSRILFDDCPWTIGNSTS